MTVIERLKKTDLMINSLLESHSKSELIKTINSILEHNDIFEELKSNPDFRNNFFALVNFYLLIDVRDGKNNLLLSKKSSKRLRELYEFI